MDGWNAVRTGAYDLVVTDVDMPRLDGIELVKLIKKDARLGSLLSNSVRLPAARASS